MGFGVVWIAPKRFTVLGNRVRQVALRTKDVTKVIVGSGVFRLEADARAILGDGLIELRLLAQDITKVIVDLGIVRLQADAARYSTMASSSSPMSRSVSPRLQ